MAGAGDAGDANHPVFPRRLLLAQKREIDQVADAELRRFEKVLTLPAETAAQIIVAGMEAREDRVLVGNDAKIASVLERIAPTRYWAVMKRMLVCPGR